MEIYIPEMYGLDADPQFVFIRENVTIQNSR
jgi:hypothetical protein